MVISRAARQRKKMLPVTGEEKGGASVRGGEEGGAKRVLELFRGAVFEQMAAPFVSVSR